MVVPCEFASVSVELHHSGVFLCLL
jgi:hypothetical protein